MERPVRSSRRSLDMKNPILSGYPDFISNFKSIIRRGLKANRVIIGTLQRNRMALIVTLSPLILYLLSASLTMAGTRDLTVDLKPVLLGIISSVTHQNISVLRGDDSESETVHRIKSNLVSAPLDTSALSGVKLYFPLNNNDLKNYEGNILGGTYYTTYRYSQVFFNGRNCYAETDSLDGSRTYYAYSGSELQMLGGSIGSDSFAFDTPLRILNDSILDNGGSLQSSTTCAVEGIAVTFSVTVISTLTGSVTIPLGRVDNCRLISMSMSISIPGESETFEAEDVWTLAPNIGKLRIGVLDEFLTQRGWLNLTSGTVGGQDVIDIITPIAADFWVDILQGFSPLTVQFTNLSSGSIYSWYWDFGDGTASSSQNPQHVFSSPGIYTVSLTVTGPNGSDTESKANYINVKEIKAMPWIPLLLDD